MILFLLLLFENPDLCFPNTLWTSLCNLPLQTFFFWTLLLFLLNLLFLFFWGQFHTDVPILVKRKIYNIANNSQIYVSSLYMIKLPKPVKFYHKFKSTFPTCFFSFSFSLFVSTSSFFFVELTYVFLFFLLFFLSHNPKSSNRPTVTGFTGWKQTIPYLQFDAIGTAGECRFFQKKLCWSSTPLASLSLSLMTTSDISLLSLFSSFFCWDDQQQHQWNLTWPWVLIKLHGWAPMNH